MQDEYDNIIKGFASGHYPDKQLAAEAQKKAWISQQNMPQFPGGLAAMEKKGLEAVDEYIIAAFFGPYTTPIFNFAKDAAGMHKVVEDFRLSNSIPASICVFKRMLRMNAKTEWETVDADL